MAASTRTADLVADPRRAVDDPRDGRPGDAGQPGDLLEGRGRARSLRGGTQTASSVRALSRSYRQRTPLVKRALSRLFRASTGRLRSERARVARSGGRGRRASMCETRLVGAILGLCGLTAAVVGAWRGYASRGGDSPLVHAGSRHARRSRRPGRSSPGRGSGSSSAASRSRSAGSPSRCTGCSWPRWAGAARMTVGTRRLLGLERYEAVIGIEVHCQLRTAQQDVLRLLDRLRRRAAEHPHLPGLPRPARRPPDDQPAGRRARPDDRPRDRGDDARRRPAGTARTTSTRTCRRATRSASTTCRSRRRCA